MSILTYPLGFIGGGDTNIIHPSGTYSTLAGGQYGCIKAAYGSIGGGRCNHVCADYGFIGAGCCNCITNSCFFSSSIFGSDITAVSGKTLHTNRLWLSADASGCSLPIADPKVEGTVWRDGTDLKISVGP